MPAAPRVPGRPATSAGAPPEACAPACLATCKTQYYKLAAEELKVGSAAEAVVMRIAGKECL
jgi:hypothetical protein